MKKVLTILAIAAFAFSFTSCKKCIECTIVAGGITTSSQEYCGKKSEIQQFEDDWDDACALLKLFDPSLICSCKDS